MERDGIRDRGCGNFVSNEGNASENGVENQEWCMRIARVVERDDESPKFETLYDGGGGGRGEVQGMKWATSSLNRPCIKRGGASRRGPMDDEDKEREYKGRRRAMYPRVTTRDTKRSTPNRSPTDDKFAQESREDCLLRPGGEV